MPSKRKVSSSLAAGRRSNEPKADYPCDICTDSRTSNSIIKTKIIDSKYSQNFKGHLECIQLIEELSLVEMTGIKKVVINDRKDYRYRQQLVSESTFEKHCLHWPCLLEMQSVYGNARRQDPVYPWEVCKSFPHQLYTEERENEVWTKIRGREGALQTELWVSWRGTSTYFVYRQYLSYPLIAVSSSESRPTL
jgi:hypothetical protein